MSDAAYKEAASRARAALYASPQPGTDVLEALCDRAKALAPDASHRAQWDRYLAALAPGHRLVTKTYSATITTGDEIEYTELIADLETAFEGVDT